MSPEFIEPHWKQYSESIDGVCVIRHDSRLFGVQTLYTINAELFDLYGRSYKHMMGGLMMEWTDLHIYSEIPGNIEEGGIPVFHPFPIRLYIKKKLIHKLEDITKKYPEVYRIMMHAFKVHVHFEYVLRSKEDFDMLQKVIDDIIEVLPNEVRINNPRKLKVTTA